MGARSLFAVSQALTLKNKKLSKPVDSKTTNIIQTPKSSQTIYPEG